MTLRSNQVVASRPQAGPLVERLMLLLKQFAGFRASPQIQRKLERIFQNSADLNDFILAVERDATKTELIALVEDLTNHETYFFRERAHLDAMEQIVIPALIQKKKQQGGTKKITLWSAAIWAEKIGAASCPPSTSGTRRPTVRARAKQSLSAT